MIFTPVHLFQMAGRQNGALVNTIYYLSMKHSIIMKPGPLNGDDKLEDVQHSLDIIELKLDAEILAKQKTIDRQELEIQRLHLLIEGKDKMILHTGEMHAECIGKSEGNRQLINKLLNDIDRLNQDIEWYKRTYEKRSMLGMIREQVLKKKS